MAQSFISRMWSALRQDEEKSPLPREVLPPVEPIGFGNEVEPLDRSTLGSPAAVVQAAIRVSQNRSREARYTDFDLMDNSDIAAMIDGVVDAVLTFEDVASGRGFKVEADDTGVQALFDRAMRQADLQQLAEEVLRDFLKYGDGFVEPLFVGRELAGAQTYHPSQIVVTKDDKNRAPKGADADGFPVAFQQKRSGSIVAGWQPWEMVHFKFSPSRKLLYSRVGLLDGLRSDWRKLQLVEQGMVVARITRAYPRRVHYVDVTGKDRGKQEETLRNYITRLQKKQFGKKATNSDSLPLVDVSDDLYITTGYTTGPDGKPTPMLNKTEIEDPATAGLSELADVNYLRQKSWSQVPSDLVGIRRNTTGDLDTQDIAFTRLLRRCQRQLEIGLRGIFDQVLLANGRLPSTIIYRITMPTIDIRASWKNADARFRASMTVRNVLEMGMGSRRWALRQMYNLSDKEIDLIWKEIGEEAVDPIFQLQLQPARNGQPSVTGDVQKAGNDGNAPVPTAPASVAVTKNGIDRGTDLGQRNRGELSGG